MSSIPTNTQNPLNAKAKKKRATINPETQGAYLRELNNSVINAGDMATTTLSSVDVSEYNRILGKDFSLDDPNLDYKMGKEQPIYEQLAAGLLNFGTIATGTALEGVGWWFEVGKIAQLTLGVESAQKKLLEDPNWLGNNLTEAGQAIKEWGEEVAPIYEKTPGEFGFNDAVDLGFWSKGIANTLGVVIGLAAPGGAAVKMMGALGKYLGVAAKAGASPYISGISQAVMSRMSESAMETQSYLDQATGARMTALREKHNELKLRIDQEYAAEVAQLGLIKPPTGEARGNDAYYAREELDAKYKKRFQDEANKLTEQESTLLGEGATSVMRKNWAMLIQDIPQYLLMGRLGPTSFAPIKAQERLSRYLKSNVSRFKGKSLAQINKTSRGILKAVEVGTESLEEGWQGYAIEDAVNQYLYKLGLEDEKAFTDLALTNGNMEQMFWGAFGGKFGSPVMAKAMGVSAKEEARKQDDLDNQRDANVQERANVYKKLYENTAIIDVIGSEEESMQARKMQNIHLTTMAMADNRFEEHIEMLQAMDDVTQEQLDNAKTPEAKKELLDKKAAVKTFVSEAYKLAKATKKYTSKYQDPFAGAQLASIELMEEEIEASREKYQTEFSKLEEEEASISKLSPTARERYNILAALETLKSTQNYLERIQKESDLSDNPEMAKVIQGNLESVKAQIEIQKSKGQLFSKLRLGENDVRTEEEKKEDDLVFKAVRNSVALNNARNTLGRIKAKQEELRTLKGILIDPKSKKGLYKSGLTSALNKLDIKDEEFATKFEAIKNFTEQVYGVEGSRTDTQEAKAKEDADYLKAYAKKVEDHEEWIKKAPDRAHMEVMRQNSALVEDKKREMRNYSYKELKKVLQTGNLVESWAAKELLLEHKDKFVEEGVAARASMPYEAMVGSFGTVDNNIDTEYDTLPVVEENGSESVIPRIEAEIKAKLIDENLDRYYGELKAKYSMLPVPVLETLYGKKDDPAEKIITDPLVREVILEIIEGKNGPNVKEYSPFASLSGRGKHALRKMQEGVAVPVDMADRIFDHIYKEYKEVAAAHAGKNTSFMIQHGLNAEIVAAIHEELYTLLDFVGRYIDVLKKNEAQAAETGLNIEIPLPNMKEPLDREDKPTYKEGSAKHKQRARASARKGRTANASKEQVNEALFDEVVEETAEVKPFAPTAGRKWTTPPPAKGKKRGGKSTKVKKRKGKPRSEEGVPTGNPVILPSDEVLNRRPPTETETETEVEVAALAPQVLKHIKVLSQAFDFIPMGASLKEVTTILEKEENYIKVLNYLETNLQQSGLVANSINNAAWGSINNKELDKLGSLPDEGTEEHGRVRDITELFESRSRSVEGMPFTVSVDMDFLEQGHRLVGEESIPEFTEEERSAILTFLGTGKMPAELDDVTAQYLIDNIPIKATLPSGEVFHLHVRDWGLSAGMFGDRIEDNVSENPAVLMFDGQTLGELSSVEQQTAAFRLLVQEIVLNAQIGVEVKGKIEYKTGGYIAFNTPYRTVGSLLSSPKFKGSEVSNGTIVLSDGKNFVKNKESLDVLQEEGGVLTTTEETAGIPYLEAFNLNGQVRTLALSRPILSAEYATAAYEAMLSLATSGKVDFDAVYPGSMISGKGGITYREFLGNLVQSTPKDNRFDFRITSKDGITRIKAGTKYMSVKEFKAKKNEVVSWLSKEKRMQVNMDMMGKAFRESFAIGTRKFMKGTTYQKFLTDHLETNIGLTDSGDFYYQPTVRLSSKYEATPVESTPNTSVEETDNAVPQTSENNEDTAGNDVGLGDMFNFRDASTADEARVQIDEAEARVLLQDILGDDVPLKVINDIASVAKNGKGAFGAFVTASRVLNDFGTPFGIYLSRNQPAGKFKNTIYHEAFHAVMDLYLSAEERRGILDENKARFPGMSDSQIEERLAEEFREVANEAKGKTKGFFQRLKDMLKALVGLHKTTTLYKDILRGKFKNSKPLSNRVSAFTKSVKFSNIAELLPEEEHALVEGMTYFIAAANVNSLEEDGSLVVPPGYVQGVLKNFRDKIYKDNPDYTRIYNGALGNITSLNKSIQDYFQALRINATFDDADLFDDVEDEVERYNRSAYEVSPTEKASASVKLLLSSLPVLKGSKALEAVMANKPVESVDDFLERYEVNPITGLPMISNPVSTYNYLLENLSKLRQPRNFKAGENDLLTLYINKVESLLPYRSELSAVLKKLKDPEYPMEKKVQFVIAFDMQGFNFSSSLFKPKMEGEGKNKKRQVDVTVHNSDPNSASSILVQEWSTNLNSSSLVRNTTAGNILNEDKVNNVIKRYEEIVKGFNSLIETKRRTVGSHVPANVSAIIEDYKLRLISNDIHNPGVLTSIGMTVGMGGLNKLLESKKTPTKNDLIVLKELLDDLAYVFSSTAKGSMSLAAMLLEQDTPTGLTRDSLGNIDAGFLSERIVGELSSEELQLRQDLGETTVVGADGSKYWKYGLKYYASNIIDAIRNSDEAVINDLMRDAYTKHSVIVPNLSKPKFAEKLKIELLNHVRDTSDFADKGTKAKEVSPIEDIVNNLTRVLAGDLPLLAMADKGQVLYLKGVNTPRAVSPVKGNPNAITLSDAGVDVLTGYFLDEYNRMDEAADSVEKFGGNAQRSILFPMLSRKLTSAQQEGLLESPRLQELRNELFPEGQVIRPLSIAAVQSKPHFVDYIRHTFRDAYTKELNNLETLGVFDTLSEKYLSRYSKVKDPKLRKGALAMEYTLRGIIGGVETMKLFAGDPAYYDVFNNKTEEASLSNLTKRIVAIIAPGVHTVHIEGVTPKTFNMKVSKDIKRNSKKVIASYIKGLESIYGNIGIEDKVLSEYVARISEGYAKNELVDASGYITMERLMHIQQGLGKMAVDVNKSKQAKEAGKATKAQKLLLAAIAMKEGRATKEDMKMVLAQPLKGMTFSKRLQNGKSIPTYVKYSQAVLVPQIIKHSPELQMLADNMATKNIDEHVFISGVKVGAQGVTNMHDTVQEESVMTFNQSDWKLQQDMGSKYDKTNKTSGSTQMYKNAKANVKAESTYTVQGTPYSGEDMITHLNMLEATRSDLGKLYLGAELGVTFNENGEYSGIKNKDLLYEALIADAAKKGMSPNIIEMLEARVDLSLILQGSAQLQGTFSSKVTKRTVKMPEKGGAFVQMPALGFEKYDKSNSLNEGIIWLDNKQALEPMRFAENAKGEYLNQDGEVTTDINQARILGADVLVPFSVVSKIPGYQKMTNEQIASIINNSPAIKNLLGFRIPNQGFSSIDLLNVVGVLPPTYGDSIVVYPELTTKTGSDFDIDKLYVLEQHVEYRNGVLEPVKYMREEESTVEERFEAYMQEFFYNSPVSALETIAVERERNEKIQEKYQDIKAMQKALRDNPGSLADLEKAKTMLLEMANDHGYTMRTLFEKATGMTLEDFAKKDEMSQQTMAALENTRFDYYKSILTHKDTFLQAVLPLDAAWLKDGISKLTSKRKLKALEFFTPGHQLTVKEENLGGKNGISGVANTLVDIPLTQAAGVYAATTLGLKEYARGDSGKATSLSEIHDDEGYYITDNISALLNAFVDIAKDPYISLGNINSTTLDIALLLFRVGTNRNMVLDIMNTPEARALHTATVNYDNRFTGVPTFKEGKSKGRFMAPMQYALSLMGVKETEIPTKDAIVGSIYNTNKNIKPFKGIENHTPIEMLGYMHHWQKIAKQVSSQLLSSKYDTKGAGNNIAENRVSVEGTEAWINATKDTYLFNVDKKFQNTPLEAMYYNSAKLLDSMYKDLFLEATDSFVATVEEAVSLLPYVAHSEKATQYAVVQNHLKAYLFSNYSELGRGVSLDKLLKGPSSVAKKLLIVKNNSKYGVQNNFMLQHLMPVISNAKKEDFIHYNNAISASTYGSQRMTRAWEELLNHDSAEVRQFAKELIQYSVATSGLRASSKSFFQYLPMSWMVDNKVMEDYAAIKKRVEDGAVDVTQFLHSLTLNNTLNKHIVPVIKGKFSGKLQSNLDEKYFRINPTEGMITASKVVSHNNKMYLLDKVVPIKVNGEVHYTAEYKETSRVDVRGDKGFKAFDFRAGLVLGQDVNKNVVSTIETDARIIRNNALDEMYFSKVEEAEAAAKANITNDWLVAAEIPGVSKAKTVDSVMELRTAELPFSYKGVKYPSLGHALEAIKFAYGTKNAANTLKRGQVLKTKDASKLGALNDVSKVEGFDNEKWEAQRAKAATYILRALLKTHPKVAKALVQTGTAQLAHKKERTEWGKILPEVLVSLRKEFGGKNRYITPIKTTFATVEVVSDNMDNC